MTVNEGASISLRKEEFSYAYINTISTVAGYECSVKKRFMDHAGIDLSIEVPGEILSCLNPRLDAQVKCTSTDCVRDEAIYYDLKVENYNKLIHPNPGSPQFLIVVIVPEHINDWIQVNNQPEIATIIRAAAYWLSLKGKEPTNNKNTKTVEIPLNNRLTPAMLKAIMRKIAGDLQ